MKYSENLLQNQPFCGILYAPNRFLLRCAGGGEPNNFVNKLRGD